MDNLSKMVRKINGVDNFGGGLPSNRVMELILDCAELTFQFKPRVDVMMLNYLRRRLFISASIGAFQPGSRDAFER